MGFNFKTIEQANVSSGTQVLLRLDLNLSIVGGVIRDDFRLRRSLPTLEFLKSRGARTVIVSHTDSKETDSLLLVANYLKKFINLKFVATLAELPAELTRAKPGDFLFLENIRQNPGEITNDPAFAKELATFGEVYAAA